MGLNLFRQYKVKALSRQVPVFRLYEQLIIYGILVIFIPLLAASVLIFTINQKALKKELSRFTEHTAHIIYSDLQAQLSVQEEQTRLISTLAGRWTNGSLKASTAIELSQWVFPLSLDYTAVGLYNHQGQLLQQQYRASQQESVPLPKQLPETPFKTLSNTQIFFILQHSPQTYYLLGIHALTQTPHASRYLLVTQKRFDGLEQLISKQNEKLNKGFYIIDHQGKIIAGPPHLLSQKLPPHTQNRFASLADELTHLMPGVTFIVEPPHVPSFWQSVWSNSVGRWWPFTKIKESSNDEEGPTVDRVLMKLPEPTGWGLILESPYEVRQKFIKRARNQTLLLILGHLIVVVLLTLWYVSGIRRNFRQLIKGIQALADGRYSRRIRLITNWFTPFEIVYLTGEFNRMSRRREAAWLSREKLTQELKTANEQLAQLDAMKSNLMDTVSHELRTPLTSIKGYTARLIRHHNTLDADTQLKNLKVIRRQADRLNRMVDDLLTIPELEQHHLRIQLEPVLLNNSVERALQLVQHDGQTSSSFAAITVTPETSTPCWVQADNDRLEQVFVNILENAQKYGDPNYTIEVHISPAPTPSSQNPLPTQECVVTIKNRCLPEHQPLNNDEVLELFEKFKRHDDSPTRTTRGTGLGLFITRGLMEAMGGSVTGHIDQNWFTITLRLVQVSQPKEASSIL
ncbi:MAG: HAMP domain-containing sensor histidine kinase [Vampirovibrionales bacterium]